MTTSALALESDGFAALGVPPELAAALARAGVVEPFPIQAATIPDCLAGRDICGKAPTGSGKTLAFGLGILSRLAPAQSAPVQSAPNRRRRRDGRRPRALVLVPTRELAAQVEEVMGGLAAAVGSTVMSAYGGVGYAKQLAALRRGVEVLIACPGRLEDLLARGSVDLAFVEMVVIDEADRMADMGFLPAVRRLVDATSTTRQLLLFSATLDGPVEKLVRDYQSSPVRHEVVPAETRQGEVHHRFWSVAADERVTVTARTVAARGPALVFCRTKHGADRLTQRLGRFGLSTAALHGDRSQSQRERALAAFRAGRLDVLVATDVAARGIHVDAVPLVVHYDPPADATDYVHRSGRTGRAGADGIVVSLVAQDQVQGAQRLQRQLGLPGRLSAAEVASLPELAGNGPRRRKPRTVPSLAEAPGARADGVGAARRTVRRRRGRPGGR
ncbi:MAG TPA: DEAD/DEAH box helicase [Acidimicrobiales bacterium]|nr:DEAD/DEAH box helicase [Acidimicrobiales bacterium]